MLGRLEITIAQSSD